MDKQTDLGLIAACQQGDAAAFRQVFDLNRERVYRLCSHMAGNHQDAEDLAQESFVQAFGRIQTFRGNPRSPPGSCAWLPTATSGP